MTEIRFYHLQQARLEDVLPIILERALQRGHRIFVLTGSEERAESLNSFLWTYKPDSFLPHGTRKDGAIERQPILLSADPVNANKADVLILTEGADFPNLTEFKLICEIFDGNDPASLEISRQRWKEYKEAGHTLLYYQQAPSGKWEEKGRG